MQPPLGSPSRKASKRQWGKQIAMLSKLGPRSLRPLYLHREKVDCWQALTFPPGTIWLASSATSFIASNAIREAPKRCATEDCP